MSKKIGEGSSPKIPILLVDDDKSIQITLETVLDDAYTLLYTSDLKDAKQLIRSYNVSVVFLDINMPKNTGKEVFKALKQQYPDIQIIMFSGDKEVETVVEFMQLGAYSYLQKKGDLGEAVNRTIEAALRNRNSQIHVDSLKTKAIMEAKDSFIGDSDAIRAVYNQAEEFATATTINVLIRGETGVGKEYLAKFIHYNSDRADKPFIAINCSAIPESLMESELFGHEEGSFTNATSRKLGRFEQAHGGTLFLDEIGTMPIHMQAKLLRVLQDKVIDRVGGEQSIPIDVRFISATNANLEEEMSEGNFRDDLYFRLKGLELTIPPVRDRKEDLEDIFDFFVHKHCKAFNLPHKKIDSKIIKIFSENPWPGNLREINAFVELLVFSMKEESKITLNNFPKEWRSRLFLPYEAIKSKPKAQRQCIIEHLIELCGGNVSAAAEILGIERSTIYRQLEAEPKASS